MHGPQQIAVAEAVTHQPANKRVNVGADKLGALTNRQTDMVTYMMTVTVAVHPDDGVKFIL